jgi:hypothetical protein
MACAVAALLFSPILLSRLAAFTDEMDQKERLHHRRERVYNNIQQPNRIKIRTT